MNLELRYMWIKNSKRVILTYDPKNQLVAWDMWPRGEQGRYQWQIKGDVPYQIETAENCQKRKNIEFTS